MPDQITIKSKYDIQDISQNMIQTQLFSFIIYCRKHLHMTYGATSSWNWGCGRRCQFCPKCYRAPKTLHYTAQQSLLCPWNVLSCWEGLKHVSCYIVIVYACDYFLLLRHALSDEVGSICVVAKSCHRMVFNVRTHCQCRLFLQTDVATLKCVWIREQNHRSDKRC